MSTAQRVVANSLTAEELIILAANRGWNWDLTIDSGLDLDVSTNLDGDLGTVSLSDLLDELASAHDFCWTADTETTTISIEPSESC